AGRAFADGYLPAALAGHAKVHESAIPKGIVKDHCTGFSLAPAQATTKVSRTKEILRRWQNRRNVQVAGDYTSGKPSTRTLGLGESSHAVVCGAATLPPRTDRP